MANCSRVTPVRGDQGCGVVMSSLPQPDSCGVRGESGSRAGRENSCGWPDAESWETGHSVMRTLSGVQLNQGTTRTHRQTMRRQRQRRPEAHVNKALRLQPSTCVSSPNQPHKKTHTEKHTHTYTKQPMLFIFGVANPLAHQRTAQSSAKNFRAFNQDEGGTGGRGWLFPRCSKRYCLILS